MTTLNNERVDPMKKVLLFLAVLAAGIASAAELELVKAFYGSKDLVADVTETVRKMLLPSPACCWRCRLTTACSEAILLRKPINS